MLALFFICHISHHFRSAVSFNFPSPLSHSSICNCILSIYLRCIHPAICLPLHLFPTSSVPNIQPNNVSLFLPHLTHRDGCNIFEIMCPFMKTECIKWLLNYICTYETPTHQIDAVSINRRRTTCVHRHELLFIFCTQRGHMYLYRRTFVVVTDNKPLLRSYGKALWTLICDYKEYCFKKWKLLQWYGVEVDYQSRLCRVCQRMPST